MEIITIQCPHCKGNLHLDKDTEICFCTYCRSEVLVKDLAGTGGVTLKSLIKRGFLALEYAEWERAIDSFDQATHIDPEEAMIYVGKLLAELKLKQEVDLGKHNQDLTTYTNYQKAIRFADSKLKIKLQGFALSVEKIISEQEAEEERLRLQQEEQEAEQKAKEIENFWKEKLQKEKEQRLAREMQKAKAVKLKRIMMFTSLVIVVLLFIWIMMEL